MWHHKHLKYCTQTSIYMCTLSHTHTQMCKYKYSHICMMANLLAIFMSSLSWWKNLLWVLLIAANKLCYIHSEKNSADWKLHLCRFSTVTGVRSLYFTPSLQLRVYHKSTAINSQSTCKERTVCLRWDLNPRTRSSLFWQQDVQPTKYMMIQCFTLSYQQSLQKIKLWQCTYCYTNQKTVAHSKLEYSDCIVTVATLITTCNKQSH